MLAGVCVEIDEGVVALGQAVDLVGELALSSPILNVVDLAFALGDGSLGYAS